VDSISLSASIADNLHTYESVADPGFWGSVPIPRCHAIGTRSAEVRRSVRAKRGKENRLHISLFRMGSRGTFVLCTAI